MTVIASTSNYGYPIIIGDLLISAEAAQSIDLPTTSADIDMFVNKKRKFKPVTLLRKIYVIKPNLVVALAGSVFQMKFFLNELEMRSRLYDPFSKTELDAFLNEYPLENFDQSAAPSSWALNIFHYIISTIIGELVMSWVILMEKLSTCSMG
jgi:hypothetical protein